VGRPKASAPGFNYSAALKGKGGNWTFDELYKFLANPKGYVPGTAMTFAGLPRDAQRADVINYCTSSPTSRSIFPRLRQNSRGVLDGARGAVARNYGRQAGPKARPQSFFFLLRWRRASLNHHIGRGATPSQKRHNPLKRCAPIDLGRSCLSFTRRDLLSRSAMALVAPALTTHRRAPRDLRRGRAGGRAARVAARALAVRRISNTPPISSNSTMSTRARPRAARRALSQSAPMTASISWWPG